MCTVTSFQMPQNHHWPKMADLIFINIDWSFFYFYRKCNRRKKLKSFTHILSFLLNLSQLFTKFYTSSSLITILVAGWLDDERFFAVSCYQFIIKITPSSFEPIEFNCQRILEFAINNLTLEVKHSVLSFAMRGINYGFHGYIKLKDNFRLWK